MFQQLLINCWTAIMGGWENLVDGKFTRVSKFTWNAAVPSNLQWNCQNFALKLLFWVTGCIFYLFLSFLIHWADLSLSYCIFLCEYTLQFEYFKRFKGREWWWISLFLMQEVWGYEELSPVAAIGHYISRGWMVMLIIRLTFFRPLLSLSLSFTISKIWMIILTLP